MRTWWLVHSSTACGPWLGGGAEAFGLRFMGWGARGGARSVVLREAVQERRVGCRCGRQCLDQRRIAFVLRRTRGARILDARAGGCTLVNIDPTDAIQLRSINDDLWPVAGGTLPAAVT